MLIIAFHAIGLGLILWVFSLSLKTVLLAWKVALATSEITFKAATGVIKTGLSKAGLLPDEDNAVVRRVRQTRNVTRQAGRAVKKTGKTVVKAAKTTGKAVKKTVRVGKKTIKFSIKAIKAVIKALKALIAALKSLAAALIALGTVGIVILVVIALFLLASIAGIVPLMSNIYKGDGIGFAGNLALPSYQPGIVQPVNPPNQPVDPPSNPTSLYGKCEALGKWYITNVAEYKQGKMYDCPYVTGGKVGDSCAYFASAYASMVSGSYICESSSQNWYRSDSSAAAKLQQMGWKRYTVTELGGRSGLCVGDILVASHDADSYSRGGHCEVYLGVDGGKNVHFGWGNVHTSFPSHYALLTQVIQSNGQTYLNDGYEKYYGVVWRYVGG